MNFSNRTVSMRDIAKQAGVSHVTVSMSLRDNPRISLGTRQRIHGIARNLGYRSDPCLSALVAHRKDRKDPQSSPCIAWIHGSSDGLHTDLDLDSIWNGAVRSATKLGFRIVKYGISAGMTPAAMREVLRENHVFGILLPPQDHWQDGWEKFPWEEYAVVKIGHSLDVPRAHVVSPDHVSNTALACERMWERGYRRIAVVAREARCRQERLLNCAALLATRAKPSDARDIPVFKVPVLPDDRLATAFSAWLRKHRPDAILGCCNRTQALLESAGLRVPDDIGLSMITLHDARGVSGIEINHEEIGRAAVLQLHMLFVDGFRGAPDILQGILMPGRWVDGPSLPPRFQQGGSVTPDGCGHHGP